jgi:hypothetical protein
MTAERGYQAARRPPFPAQVGYSMINPLEPYLSRKNNFIF